MTKHADTDAQNKNEGFTRQQLMLLILMSIGSFSTGASVAIQVPFFPKEAESKGALPSQYGAIFSSYELFAFLSAPIFGKVIKYWPPKSIICCNMIIFSLTTIAFGFLDYLNSTMTFVVLAGLIRSLEGISSTAFRVACYSVVGVAYSNRMSTAFAILSTFVGVGFIVGPTVGGALYDIGGFGIPFYTCGVISLIDGILLCFMFPKIEVTRKDTAKGSWKKFLTCPGTIILVLLCLTVFANLGFNWVTLEPTTREFNLSSFYVGALFSITAFTYIIFTPFFGWLCDKGCKRICLSIMGSLGIMLSITFIGPMPYIGLKKSVGLEAAGLCMNGVAFSLIYAPIYGQLTKIAISKGLPQDISTFGMVSTLIVESRTLGAFIGPFYGGYALESIGYITGLFGTLIWTFCLTIIIAIYAISDKVTNEKHASKECVEPVSISFINAF